jgi:hypothetical protein
MLKLPDLQSDIGRAILEEEIEDIIAAIPGDGLSAASRLRIYRNHFLVTLTDALKVVFPVVHRLVDERFFAYAAHEFLREHPPSSRCLGEFGGAFPDFLAGFPPCAGLPYLGDVATLEWARSRAMQEDDPAPIAPSDLTDVTQDDRPRLQLALHPSLFLLRSSWSIDRIWAANQKDADGEIAEGITDPVTLAVHRAGAGILHRRLFAADFAFLQSLAAGGSLWKATELALDADPQFNLVLALRNLFQAGLVVGLSLH